MRLFLLSAAGLVVGSGTPMRHRYAPILRLDKMSRVPVNPLVINRTGLEGPFDVSLDYASIQQADSFIQGLEQ